MSLPSPDQIVWQPTDKQSEFLSAPEDEVLYGGAAGGGKSDALLVDALGLSQAAISWPGYRAILFRRSFPELRELIDRSRLIYPVAVPGATYKESTREWTFPSGAKVEFGYLESEQDRFRYQGREYQYIGWDELTQYPSDVSYRYLLSRLRSTNPEVKCYVRATCNPGGIGHEWVRKYWRIPDDGAPTRQEQVIGERKMVRRFIPARLSDNPHLANSGYRERLQTLSEVEQKALLLGRWDIVDVEGSIYAEELRAAYSQGRVTRIPVERLPVYTFWDLGRGDATAIWFMQSVGLERRFIDYYEASLKDLPHYAHVLREKGYDYACHYLPHDARNKTLASLGRSLKDLIEEQGIRPCQTVDRTQGKDVAIAEVRRAFPSCWFDIDKCSEGLKALQSYRYQWNESNQVWSREPVHDWASHGADAFAQYAQGFKTTQAKAKPLNYSNAGIV